MAAGISPLLVLLPAAGRLSCLRDERPAFSGTEQLGRSGDARDVLAVVLPRPAQGQASCSASTNFNDDNAVSPVFPTRVTAPLVRSISYRLSLITATSPPAPAWARPMPLSLTPVGPTSDPAPVDRSTVYRLTPTTLLPFSR